MTERIVRGILFARRARRWDWEKLKQSKFKYLRNLPLGLSLIKDCRACTGYCQQQDDYPKQWIRIVACLNSRIDFLILDNRNTLLVLILDILAIGPAGKGECPVRAAESLRRLESSLQCHRNTHNLSINHLLQKSEEDKFLKTTWYSTKNLT